MKAKKRTCKLCGKEFTTTAPNKQYCSEECSRSVIARYHEDHKREKPCRMCGKMYIASRDYMCYCSDECKAERSIERKNERTLESVLYGYERKVKRLRKRLWDKQRTPKAETVDRIDELLEELDITAGQLADGCGVDRHTLYVFLEGRTATLSLGNIVKISEHTGKSIDWIMGY